MHRRSMRAAVGIAAIAALTLAACGSKESGDPGTGASSTSAATSGSETSGSETGAESTGTGTDGLSIAAVVQVDAEGAEAGDAGGGDAEPADPAGTGDATCEGVAIAMAGALTGPNAALGQNILGGASLALKEHNDANPGCQVELKEFDTEGDPQKATGVAPTIVGDSSIIGLLGPAFSGETGATGDIFFQAGLLSLTASATRVDLTTNGWTTFFRGLANDGVQGPSVANYMVNTAGLTSICVIEDNTDYGIGLADEVTATLGDAANSSCSAQVKTGDKDFSAAVNAVKSSDADAVFYSGYYAEAAPFVKQLRDAGVEATFVSADGVNDPQFVSQAGSSSEGAILSCPCGPAPEEFAARYTELNGAEPGVYSVEGYDLTTIILKAIDEGVTERQALVDYVAGYDGPGLARNYSWDDSGELTSALIWMYEVQ